MEQQHEGFGHPATDAEGATTAQPERELQPGNPILMGAAPAEEKKGIAGRVKGIVGRHGRKKHGAQNQEHDAVAEGGILQKIKAKASSKVGHGQDGSKHGPARLLSKSSSMSSLSSSDEEDIGTVGFAMDPTGPAVAGSTLGREDFSSAPQGPGADFSVLALHSDHDDDRTPNGYEMARHSERAAQYAKSSNPMNPSYGEEPGHSHPTDPRNETLDESHHSETSNSDLTPKEEAALKGTDNSSATANSEPGEAHGHGHSSRGGSVKQEVRKVLNAVH